MHKGEKNSGISEIHGVLYVNEMAGKPHMYNHKGMPREPEITSFCTCTGYFGSIFHTDKYGCLECTT